MFDLDREEVLIEGGEEAPDLILRWSSHHEVGPFDETGRLYLRYGGEEFVVGHLFRGTVIDLLERHGILPARVEEYTEEQIARWVP